MKSKHPKVSIIIPTFNEERNIKNCLNSIFSQDFPKECLEVIVVDDKSIDKTVEIAQKYPVKIFFSGKRHAEISKMIGFKKATGSYAVYLDADIELRGKDWITKMLKPLIDDSDIIGSFTRYYTKKTDPSIERYLTFDPLQRDSIYQFFSPSIDETITEKRSNYYVCNYKEGKIPPAGLCLYRRKELLNLVSEFDMFLELDFLVLLVRNKYHRFAYVPEAGMFHHHASSLPELIKKRKYNLTKVYFTHVENKLYTWFDLNNKLDLLRIFIWVIYVNLILPSVIVGIYKSIKNKDWAGFYEPIVNILVTDTLVLFFLIDKRSLRLLRG